MMRELKPLFLSVVPLHKAFPSNFYGNLSLLYHIFLPITFLLFFIYLLCLTHVKYWSADGLDVCNLKHVLQRIEQW